MPPKTVATRAYLEWGKASHLNVLYGGPHTKYTPLTMPVSISFRRRKDGDIVIGFSYQLPPTSGHERTNVFTHSGVDIAQCSISRVTRVRVSTERGDTVRSVLCRINCAFTAWKCGTKSSLTKETAMYCYREIRDHSDQLERFFANKTETELVNS